MSSLARFTRPRWVVSILLLTLASLFIYAFIQSMREDLSFGRYSLDYYLFIAPFKIVREFPTFGLKEGTLSYEYGASDGWDYTTKDILFTSSYSEAEALRRYTEYCAAKEYKITTRDTPKADLWPSTDLLCRKGNWEIDIYLDERSGATFIALTFRRY